MSPERPSDPNDVQPNEEARTGADAPEAPQADAGPPAGKGQTREAGAPPKRRRGLRARRAQAPAQPAGEEAPDAGGKDAAAVKGETEAEPPAAEPPAPETPADTPAPGPAAAKAPGEAAARPAPAPRRVRKAPSGRPRRRVVRARARYVRTPARKARIVCLHLRGKSVAQARAILAFTPREVARDWSRLLESAVANAENNHELLEDDLIIREAYADEGPTIKRFRPRAMGRATPIRKRTSHLTITLTARPDTTKRAS